MFVCSYILKTGREGEEIGKMGKEKEMAHKCNRHAKSPLRLGDQGLLGLGRSHSSAAESLMIVPQFMTISRDYTRRSTCLSRKQLRYKQNVPHM